MLHTRALGNWVLRHYGQNGSLVNSWVERNFSNALKIAHATDLPIVKPLTAVISPLLQCNSRCVYCNSWKKKNSPAPTTEEWKRVVKELAEFGITELVFSGGEPLLDPRLEKIVQTARNVDLFSHVITNGILFSERRMLSLAKAGVGGLTLSLDSLDDAEYRATRGIPVKAALRALDILSKFKAQWPDRYVGINVVVTAKNLTAYKSLIDMAKQRGFYVAFQAYTWHPDYPEKDLLPTPKTMPHFEKAIKRIIQAKKAGAPVASSFGYLEGMLPFLSSRAVPDDFKCMAAFLGVNIDIDFNIVPCWHLPPVGNLREASLKDIWYSDRFLAARKKMRRLECPKCWILCHTDFENMSRRRRKRQNDDLTSKSKLA